MHLTYFAVIIITLGVSGSILTRKQNETRGVLLLNVRAKGT